MLHLSTNVVSNTNKIQVMAPDYGKWWYNDKAIANILSLSNLYNNTESNMTHTKIMLSLLTAIERSSSSETINMVFMY